MKGIKRKRQRWESGVLVVLTVVVWALVAKIYKDYRLIRVMAGGGTECGDGCICNNWQESLDKCLGPSVCESHEGGEGLWSDGSNYYSPIYSSCDGKPTGWGNYGHDYVYCPGPCGGGGGGGGTCGSFSQPSCGSGTCPNGKTCVGVGNQGLCRCGGGMPAWAGYHDAYFDVQESATCRVVGWITDLNWPDRDVLIYIYLDGVHIDSIPMKLRWASLYRDGLASYCTGGTCAFDVDLNGLISYGVDHNIWIRVGVSHVLSDSGGRSLSDMKINCAEPPPVNSVPTGTLTCPSSPIYLGQSASFTLHGSDVDRNLSYAQLWVSPNSPSNPGGDWTAINANIACTGGSCSPPTQIWTPIDT